MLWMNQKIGYSSKIRRNFDKLLYASFGQVTAGSDSSWSRVQPNLIDFTRIVAIRDFLKDVCMQEDRDALEK